MLHCITFVQHRSNACDTLQGKKLVFVTNNSTKSRAGYLSKFKKLGLNIAAVSTPASLAARNSCAYQAQLL